MPVIHAIQSPITKRKVGLTACNREFRTTTFVSADLDLVTCKFCLKRCGHAEPTNKALSVDPGHLNLYIAARILEFRKSANLSQDMLAAVANMPRVRVSLLERGEIKVGVAELLIFSGIFRKKLTDFLPGRNAMNGALAH